MLACLWPNEAQLRLNIRPKETTTTNTRPQKDPPKKITRKTNNNDIHTTYDLTTDPFSARQNPFLAKQKGVQPSETNKRFAVQLFNGGVGCQHFGAHGGGLISSGLATKPRRVAGGCPCSRKPPLFWGILKTRCTWTGQANTLLKDFGILC